MTEQTEQQMGTRTAKHAARYAAAVFAPAALISAVLFISVTGLVLLITTRVAVPVARVTTGRRAPG